MDEIITPHLIGILGPSRGRRALAHRAPLAGALLHLEPLLLPEPPDRLTTDASGFTLQQVVELPIPKARRLLRQRMDTLGQLGLVRLA